MVEKKQSRIAEPLTVSKEDFGRVILSHFILQQEDNFRASMRDIDKESNVDDCITFLRYMVYIVEKILETKYSQAYVLTMVDSCLTGIAYGLEFIPPSKQQGFAELLVKQ